MSSLWNTITGGNKDKQQAQNVASHMPTSPTPAPSAPATSASAAPTYDPTQNTGVESFLKPSAFADPTMLHPLAGLDKDTLEYITLDDASLPGGQSVIASRGFTDDLCYGTGITYLTALTLGGAWGLQEGLRRSEGQPPKLRLNSVLNAVTKRGPFLGNSAGVIAITYNSFNAVIGAVRGKHDAANSIVAGFLSGAMFRSTKGVKPMLIAGGVVSGFATAWVIAKKALLPEEEQLPPRDL
ncbi:Mitochondrial import inner membrane translocase subunit TIM23 [Ceratocystis lukuohia]|uniref:Mitochondrial import inner membrane translocase subunit TIM23 n=3 Tax=Ceratocystis TaxID=5157 RepID=A0A0F8B8R5_CERFI|nr:Mitochondrial import inner membrane translocase subunit TIM23 [Ceratocystis platani]PHH55426.1 Mitochondrial import inner membrane translocase subunit TIM23 [Ceratocystis fimbriata CBS 114723]